MADQATLRRVDLAHRAQQVTLAERIARLIAGYWLLVDPDNTSGPGGVEWLNKSVSAIQSGRRSSILLNRAYAETIHQLQVPRAPRLEFPEPPVVSEAKLRRSLAFTGLGYVAVETSKVPDEVEPERGVDQSVLDEFERGRQSREHRIKIILDQGITQATKASVKHVVDGARDSTDQIVKSKVALGYFRVTQSKNPCGFCLALASRGPVYEDDSFAESNPRFTGPGNHKAHDGCMCTLRPVFTRSEDEWSEQARTADRLWGDFGTHKDGRSAMENFRRAARERGLADLNRW